MTTDMTFQIRKKCFFYTFGRCTQLLHGNFALKSRFKSKSHKNMKKTRKEWRFLNRFFLVCWTFGCKDMTCWFWKKCFFTKLTVVHCDTRWVWAYVFGWWGGWKEDQHVWDGQGLKDPCFLELFLESQKHREKLFF